MFKALDRVNYDTLKLNMKQKPQLLPFQVKSLTDLTCIALNWYYDLLNENLHILPKHLVPKLLKIALMNDRSLGVTTIIANWPMEVLGFADILDEENDVFDEDLDAVYFRIFEGIVGRTKHCKLKCLDFTGIKLNRWFCKLVVQSWPLLSLKKTQLNANKLADTITDMISTSLSDTDEMKWKEIFPRILEDRLNHDMIKSSGKIKLPRGGRLEVKMDDAHFSTNNMFFMDYLIANMLRSVTPLFITVSNIHITSELIGGDVIADSLVPFLVLASQDTQSLKGMSLLQLEDGALPILCQDIMKFKDLNSLDIQDCNLYLKEGVTRSRTVTRVKVCDMLGSFAHLQRLDLSFNYLIGCLGELLDALQTPLVYLSLRGCDLNVTDLTNLTKSKHAPYLRELNLSKLCSLSINESDRILPMRVVSTVKNFPRVSVLNISQNNLPDSGTKELCEVLNKNLPSLKGLDISGNILQFENQLEIAKACTRIPSMQLIRLTCISSSMNEGIFLDNYGAGTMCQRLKDVMKSNGREDIEVDIVRWSVAILVDLIDFFD